MQEKPTKRILHASQFEIIDDEENNNVELFYNAKEKSPKDNSRNHKLINPENTFSPLTFVISLTLPLLQFLFFYKLLSTDIPGKEFDLHDIAVLLITVVGFFAGFAFDVLGGGIASESIQKKGHKIYYIPFTMNVLMFLGKCGVFIMVKLYN